MMAANKLSLLLELQSEEIPASMQAKASSDLMKAIRERLRAENVNDSADGLIAESTPQRISILIPGLDESVRSGEISMRGPRDGAPAAAVEGFARKHGVGVSQLTVGRYKNQNYYFWKSKGCSRQTRDILPKILESEIGAFTWPKSMRWGSGEELWVRPLRSILCILFSGCEHEIVDFKIGAIRSGDTTRGHRFMSSEAFSVSDFDSYENGLLRAKVLLRAKERRKKILDSARQLSALNGRELIEDPELLHEVAGLVEWPCVLIGDIDERFQTLPPAILLASMKKHQRYLSARDPKSGNVTNFIVVANRETGDGGVTILAGNRRVLTARLEDAAFFLANDRRRIASIGLDGMAEALRSVNYHSKLGSQWERSERMSGLAGQIARRIGADADASEQVAKLAKADLVSDVVDEFPHLQGIMGRNYAEALGMESSIAVAIEQHYSPLSASDRVPRDALSIVVGLADRIDHLTGMLGIGERPGGSKDPHALRRTAIGIIRLVLENDIRLPLADVFRFAAAQYARGENQSMAIEIASEDEIVTDALGFVHERLRVHFRDRGMRNDILDACFHAPIENGDLVSMSKQLDALAAFAETRESAELIQGFRRVNNILNAEQRVGKLPSSDPVPALMSESAELDLMKAVEFAFKQIADALSREDFLDAFQSLVDLRGPIDSFFETVRVNDDEPAVRSNRISALLCVRRLFEMLADFSQLE